METAKKFKAAINRSFSEKGGVLWQGITDNQLTPYIMKMTNAFVSNNGKKIRGTLVIGRQPNLRAVDANGEFVDNIETGAYREKDDFDSAVYVLNEHVQVGFLIQIIFMKNIADAGCFNTWQHLYKACIFHIKSIIMSTLAEPN